jgi:HlyD family secretion protein
MKKNIVKLIFLLIILALGAFFYKKRVDEAVARNKIAPKQLKPLKVRTHKIEKDTVNKSIFASGTVRAVNRHLLYFEAKGKTINILVKDGQEIKAGDRVKKGDILAELDIRDLNEEIKSYKAQIEHLDSLDKQYTADIKKYEELFRSGAVALQQLEKQRLEGIKARADLVNARSSLNKTLLTKEKSKIVSPANGIVAYKNIKKGDYINGAPSGSESEILKITPFVILEDQLMEITVKVPAFNALKIKAGLRAKIFPVIIPPEYYDKIGDITSELKPLKKFGKTIQAEVYSVSPSVDDSSRSIEVKIRTTESNSFQDGLQLSCQIIVASESNLPVVPMNSVLFENRKAFCFILNNGIAERRILSEFGVINTEKAAVKKGVKEGEMLITEGKHNLVNGTPVQEVK